MPGWIANPSSFFCFFLRRSHVPQRSTCRSFLCAFPVAFTLLLMEQGWLTIQPPAPFNGCRSTTAQKSSLYSLATWVNFMYSPGMCHPTNKEPGRGRPLCRAVFSGVRHSRVRPFSTPVPDGRMFVPSRRNFGQSFSRPISPNHSDPT